METGNIHLFFLGMQNPEVIIMIFVVFTYVICCVYS